MKIVARWSELPPRIREHLLLRLAERKISVQDLSKLDFWLRSDPEVPSGQWYKDFGTFKLCGHGRHPKTFLDPEMTAYGEEL